jgi:uncharacterized protein with FMN-binding domain
MEKKFDKNSEIYKVMNERDKEKENLSSKREKALRGKYLSITLALASAVSSLFVAYPVFKGNDYDDYFKTRQEVKEYFVNENKALSSMDDGTYVAKQEAFDTFLTKNLREEYNKKAIESIDKEVSEVKSSEKYKDYTDERKSRKTAAGILAGLAFLLGIEGSIQSKKASDLEKRLEWMNMD